MGQTITEKILARAAGLTSTHAGQEIEVKPDYVIAYDFPGYTDVIFKQMEEEFGIKQVAEPERLCVSGQPLHSCAGCKEVAVGWRRF